MRMMAILFGAAIFVYVVTGIRNRFPRRTRLYFALAAMIIVYLFTMLLVLLGGDP
jgi:uncharacterized membrane protein YcjF (UPF0283 family)